LRDNDWIRLYLELTLVAHDRFLTVVSVFSLFHLFAYQNDLVAFNIGNN